MSARGTGAVSRLSRLSREDDRQRKLEMKGELNKNSEDKGKDEKKKVTFEKEDKEARYEKESLQEIRRGIEKEEIRKERKRIAGELHQRF